MQSLMGPLKQPITWYSWVKAFFTNQMPSLLLLGYQLNAILRTVYVGWNMSPAYTGALDPDRHPQRTQDQIMIIPHFYRLVSKRVRTLFIWPELQCHIVGYIFISQLTFFAPFFALLHYPGFPKYKIVIAPGFPETFPGFLAL